MKTDDSSERLKTLMRTQSTRAAASIAAPTLPASIPPAMPPATMSQPPTPQAAPNQQIPVVKWGRVTIRLTAGELEKINDVVIATQQANRTGKITATDVLRTALRRVKDQEAIKATEIAALRAQDARTTNRRAAKPS